MQRREWRWPQPPQAGMQDLLDGAERLVLGAYEQPSEIPLMQFASR
jgi:hypothetical protein